MVLIACSQVGYRESEEDTISTEEGLTKGYTRYGAWYGDPYADWNAIFIRFCLYFAHCATDELPFDADCAQWLDALHGEELIADVSDAAPLKGDIVFTVTESENIRAGVVSDLQTADGESLLILIEGDCDGAVASQPYSLDSDQIIGYVKLAEREEEKEDKRSLESVVAALPLEKLTGDWAADLLTIAYSQLGYTESPDDYITNGEGTTKGYTCFGEFYEQPYGDWCAMFIGFCLYYANVPENRFPRSPGVNEWIALLKEKELYKQPQDYRPAAGDVVFLGPSPDYAVHVGIVSSTFEGDDGVTYIRAIHGNSDDDSVCESVFAAFGGNTIGYGALDAAKGSRSLQASVFTDSSKDSRMDPNEISIVVSGDLPNGAYAEAFPARIELPEGEHLFSAWDITLFDLAGERIRPENGPVLVTITTLAADEALASCEELGVYHLHEGALTVLERAPTVSDDSFAFETDAFSVFALGSVPYSGDYIHINQFNQLLLIGSDAFVTDTDLIDGELGFGAPVLGSDGEPLLYSSRAHYYLDSDIAFPEGEIWKLPDGFTGNFAGPDETDKTRLYDKDSDSIYIENQYQLAVLSAEDRENSPVLTDDYDASGFGMGQMIYPEGDESGEPLCYGAEHRYVLSSAFCVDRYARPLSLRKAPARGPANADPVDGRDHYGQTSIEIDGTTYILIGDRQQLDAINADGTTRTKVCKPVYKATEGAVEVWRTNLHLTGDWIWLSEFDGTRDLKDGNGYGTTADEVMASYRALSSGAEVIYPGDADLIGSYESWPLYDEAPSGTYHRLDRPAGTAIGAGSSRDVYFTLNPSTGAPDIGTATLIASDPNDGALTYTKNGDYIVFRDIDMSVGYQVTQSDGERGDWKPLMFSGSMCGITSTEEGQTVRDIEDYIDNSGSAAGLAIGQLRRPVLSNVCVTAVTKEQLGKTRLDHAVQEGVGFFGTIVGEYNSSNYLSEPVAVKNIKLYNGTVTNTAAANEVDTSLVDGLLTGLGWVVGGLLDTLLFALTGKDNYNTQDMLTSLLGVREKDPTLLATGAFAGRILADAAVEDCEAEAFTVTTVETDFENGTIFDSQKTLIVGKGGFVGYTEGETRYSGLSTILGGLVTALDTILNMIPGLGLGDLVTLLLKNVVDVGKLIPTGYTSPHINRCTADNVSLSTEGGKLGVGGFVGSMCGTVMNGCRVVNNASLTIRAEKFGGGFAGVARDAEIKASLSGLGVNILSALQPQSELIGCYIDSCTLHVGGGAYLGGFVGALANSYAINDTIYGSTSLTVAGSGNYVGGFCGRAQLGSLFTLGDFLPTQADLLGTVSGLLTSLLSTENGMTLLDIGGVASSGIMGCQVLGAASVSSGGSYVGGILGRGDGTYIMSSKPENLRRLPRYDDTDSSGSYVKALPISASAQRDNLVSHLSGVSAGGSFAGGLAGYLTTANVGGLLGDTVGVAQFLGFTVCDTTIQGIDTGYSVSAVGDYAGGGLGWATGGEVYDVELLELRSAAANNYAGGFAGATGPGDLVNGGGLDLSLLGISLLRANNVLSLASGIRTTYLRANVSGVESGFTVEETGVRTGGAVDEYMSGGWAAQANSVRVVDCRAENLLSVHANMNDGYAGGFVGSSSAGGLAGVAENLNAGGQLIDASQLVGAVPYLVPSYDGCYVRYVDGGYVQADTAGGFTGNFQSGKVNTYTTEDRNPISNGTYSAEHDPGYQYGIPGETTAWSVFNIDHVRGGRYAGGWGGKVYSGALASAGGGLSVLGAANVSISASELLSVASVYVPIVNYAGVNAPSGFTVYAAHDYEDAGAPASAGMAGGFIGYGSGVQISHSDVYRLRHGSPAEPASLTAEDEAAYARFGVKPAALESQDGGSYMLFDNSPDAIPYAVAGAYYAGGYIGFMDVGSAASVGDGLRLLGSSITLTNVLDALSVVVSTVEHSHVTGCPGGFSVVASPRVNLHNGGFGDSSGLGRGYAGGYAGKMAGGHIQDGNVNLFYYIIGEIAAGGYAGEMIPGDAASVLRDGSSLSLLGSVDNLASLVQDFVPTIRNSETNCVPCGGAVRAQCFSDDSGNAGSIVRGMAGGYVGHCKGGQIWGWSNDRWKAEATYSGTQRECAAIRIRSVYGAEYAGGFAGLAEPGSTASTGGLSLLGGLVNASNLLSALETAYPTIKRAAVYGPLEQVDEETWDAWVQYVGSYGGFYPEIARTSYAELENYIYGTHVVAGRHSYDSWATTALSGTAGGFVGSLHSGVIRHSRAVDSKLVISMRSSGGFAGELQIKGAAGLGSVELLGLGLNLGQVVNVLDVFVAEISESGTEGYQKGLTVVSYGDRSDPGVGMAGGFAGGSYGGQLGLHQDGPAIPSVWVHKLKTVNGTCAIGGFVGRSASGSLVDVDTNQTSNSFLQDILNSLVSTPNELASLGEATLSTIKYAEVSGVDAEWGFIVDGAYSDGPAAAYAPCAGGFAGQLEGAVLGERNKDDDTLTVTGLRLVNGGHYVGGFFGLGDTGSVAEVGGTGNSTKILGLLQAGRTTVADAFRTYIYRGSVEGVSDGLWVSAHDQKASGTLSAYRLSGAAGGFGGGLINGTVEKSQVTNLSAVEAPNYAAGFIGIMDRSGVLEAEDVGVSDEHVLGKLLTLLGLDLSANAEALAIVGSTVEDSLVRGYSPGFTATTSNRQEPVAEGSVTVVNEADLIGSCAAGFTGFGDVSQIERCTVEGLKYVRSPQIAAGFIGRGSNAYLVSLNATSGLTEGLLGLVNLLLRVLYINGLENLDLIDLPGQYAGLQLLADGNLLYINLFGLRIGVRLADAGDPEYNANSDVAIIVIGSSTIALPVTDGQIDTSSPNVSIDLIEGNRTAVKNCSVTGIDAGYDVFGGGAHQTADGSDPLGYAGGFVGYNNSGYFSHDTMVLCDTVRGTADKVGPFSGYLKYNVNTYPAAWYEGYDGSKTNDNDNRYSIYRSEDTGLTRAETAGGTKIADMTPDTSTPVTYNRYEVLHYEVIESHGDLENAVETGSSPQRDLNAYVSAAKAVLMLDTPLLGNDKGEAVAPDEMKDPCETKFDLNVHKKWRDYNDMLGTRPDELEIEIHVIDVGADPRMQLVQTIWPESGWEYPDLDLLEAQYGFTSDFGNENPIILRLHADSNDLIHWKGTLEGLPVAYETEGEIHYLQYVVVERVPEDYKLVEYRIYEDTASVVILNELAGVVLPGTGGPSYSSYYMLTGILLFIGTALLCIEHRRRRREVQNE